MDTLKGKGNVIPPPYLRALGRDINVGGSILLDSICLKDGLTVPISRDRNMHITGLTVAHTSRQLKSSAEAVLQERLRLTMRRMKWIG